MSESTWLAEYYPVPAWQAAGDSITAIRHSLKKWEGLTQISLASHGLEYPPIDIDASTCALCKFTDAIARGGCEGCPLYELLGDVDCSEDGAPYQEYDDSGDPTPMIDALRNTLDIEEATR